MQKLKIKFVDFWGNFQPDNNFFYHALKTRFDVELSNDPQILFFSNFGIEHYNYHNCKKVFYTGETRKVGKGEYDLLFGFDKTSDKSYKLPLWALYINWFNIPHPNNCNPSYLVDYNSLVKRKAEPKTKFCNFIFNNPCPSRVEFLKLLQTYKTVDCAGSLLNNIGQVISGDEKTKLDFMKDYKFSIAFENMQYHGYVTEKILHAFAANTVPIYWGSSDVVYYFNEKAFINCNNMTYKEALSKVKEIDNNPDLFQEYLSQPIFRQQEFFNEFSINAVVDRIQRLL